MRTQALRLALGLTIAAVVATPAFSQARESDKRSVTQASRSSSRNFRKPNVEVFAQYIDAAASEFQIDRALIAAVIYVESGGDPNCCSSSGAMGLMQLMPATCQDFGVAAPYDPQENIRGGSAVLSRNLTRYHGDVKKAVAAYNIGPRHVDDGTWTGIYAATHYVSKVTAIYSGNGKYSGQTFDPTSQLPVPAQTLGKNYLDSMMQTVAAKQGETGLAPLAENGGLDDAADRIIEDFVAGKLAKADIDAKAGSYTTAAGYVASEVHAVLITGPDDDSFRTGWVRTIEEPGTVMGLSHRVAPGMHVWLVLLARHS